ncbi:MAG: GTP cyclohydrolase I FolE2 [Desulfobacterales bacterium]|nr:GTP cyclohydrolase I FolE2 [Desulfobacterales bacterium]
MTVLRQGQRGIQHTTAIVNLYADLPHDFKGTHMSRFIEVFNAHRRGPLHAQVPGDAGRDPRRPWTRETAYCGHALPVLHREGGARSPAQKSDDELRLRLRRPGRPTTTGEFG